MHVIWFPHCYRMPDRSPELLSRRAHSNFRSGDQDIVRNRGRGSVEREVKF